MKGGLIKKSFLIVLFLFQIDVACGLSYSNNMIILENLIKSSRDNMVFVKGGTFIMGAANGSWAADNNTPAHKVTLTSFYISKYNTSYGDYDHYTEINNLPYIQADARKPYDYFRNADHPVDAITWYQANNYCKWLAKKTGLPYDLPTEAQWEYAATARGRPNWPFATNNGKLIIGVNFPSIDQRANQKGTKGEGDGMSPMPNGSSPPNPIGIYEMDGEVNQWMKDWYDPNYYAHSPENNPQGPKTGTLKASRGGSSDGSPDLAFDYGRYGFNPKEHADGFRCVINSSVPPNKLGATASG